MGPATLAVGLTCAASAPRRIERGCLDGASFDGPPFRQLRRRSSISTAKSTTAARVSSTRFRPRSTSLSTFFGAPPIKIVRSRLPTGAALSNVANNLLHPFEAIEKNGGTEEFIAHEVFPIKGLHAEYGQWIPNYTLHALGEGMMYRKLSSWYEAHGVPAPQLFGLLNMAAAQFINEAVENGDFTGANTDPRCGFPTFSTPSGTSCSPSMRWPSSSRRR